MTYPAQPPSLPGYPPVGAPGAVPAAYMPQNPAAAASQGYPGPAVPAPAAAPAAPQIPPGWEMGPSGLRPAAPQGFRYNAAGQLEPAAAAPPPQQQAPGYPPQGYAAPPPQQGYGPPPAPQGYGPPPQGYGPPPGATNPAGAPNPFFGVKLPGERLPDPPVGDHIFDCDKIRLTDDRTGLIVALHTAWSAVQCPPDCSTYVNLFAYRSREYSGELIKLVLSCVGCKSYEELEASGPQVKDRFVALANRVVNGEEGALIGCRIAARGYMKTAGEKSSHKGEQFLKLAVSPYRPQP
jgi:hypothetical protein